jgi:hypothetical protein
MKKVILLFMCLALVSCVTVPEIGPTYKKELTDVWKIFSDAMDKEDWDKVMEYLPDAMFNKITKEEMKSQLAAAVEKMKNAGFYMPHGELRNISDPFSAKGNTYYKIDYIVKCKMVFDDQKIENSGEIYTRMARQFGDDNVVFDKAAKTMLINMPAVTIAIYSGEKKNWKLVDITTGNPAAIRLLLPKEVLDHFVKK